MENNLERPNYMGWLPAEVRYSDISPSAKLLYAEITSLTNKTATCWASNKYFANLYNTTGHSVSRWVKELIDAGFVTSEVKKEAGNRRYLRLLTKTYIGIDKNEESYGQKGKNGLSGGDRGANNIKEKNKTNAPSASDSSFGENSNSPLPPASTAHARALLPQLIEIINPKEKPTADRLRVLNGRLKDYSEDEIIAAAKAFSKSTWHKQNKQMSVDNLIAPSKFGRWYAQKPEDTDTRELPERDENGDLVLTQEQVRERLLKEQEERDNESQ